MMYMHHIYHIIYVLSLDLSSAAVVIGTSSSTQEMEGSIIFLKDIAVSRQKPKRVTITFYA